VVWSGVDPLLTKLYDRGIYLLFTRTAQIVIAGTALIGLVVFVMNLRSVGVAIHDIAQTHRLLWLLPLFAVAVALHELGHGFARKGIRPGDSEDGRWMALVCAHRLRGHLRYVAGRSVAPRRGEPSRRVREFYSRGSCRARGLAWRFAPRPRRSFGCSP
jgi:hypothetical protein